MQIDVKKATGRLWAGYFLVTIAIIGFLLAYLLVIPFCLLGLFVPRARRIGEEIMARGVDLLMRVQPWYQAEVDILLPRREPGNMGFLTVSNHRSHLDMFVLLSRIPGIRAVTKQSLFSIPGLNVMLAVLRMIPVKRNDLTSYLDAMQRAETGLGNGDAIHVFPEMTRCEAEFRGTQEFHLLPFRMAIRANAPIIPIVFSDTDRVWPKGTFALNYRAPVAVRSLDPIYPSAFASAKDLREAVRAAIDQALRRG